MQKELFVAIFAGLGGMLGWGSADFFAKKTIDEIGSIASLFWGHIFGVIVLGIVFFYDFFYTKNIYSLIPKNISQWVLIFILGALQAIVYLLIYRGFGKGQLSVLSPIFASFPGLVIILSVAIFGEVISLYKTLILILIFAGIIFMNIDPAALKLKRLSIDRIPGLWEIVAATFLAAIWTISWDKIVIGENYISYAFFMYLFMTLVAFFAAKISKTNLSFNKPNLWKFLAPIGVCEALAYLALTFGYSNTPFLSTIAVISGGFSLPTIILARMFLKEKITKPQVIGISFIIIGIILILVI